MKKLSVDLESKLFDLPEDFYLHYTRRYIIHLTKKDSGSFWGRRKDLLERLHIDGYVEETRALFKKGTVVIVPTHFSNLDSIMLGYVIDQVAGLPAFIYGAGLNLYDNENPCLLYESIRSI